MIADVRSVYLIRHGETDWNEQRRIQGHSESSLTLTGITQARHAGDQLKSIHFDHIYCSPSQRTRQTLDIILAKLTHSAAIHFEPALKEIYLAHWEGRLHAEVAAAEPDRYEHYLHQPQLFSIANGESYFDLQQRAWNWFNDVVYQQSFRNILIISHGVWIRTLLARISATAIEQLDQVPRLDNCEIRVIIIDRELKLQLKDHYAVSTNSQ